MKLELGLSELTCGNTRMQSHFVIARHRHFNVMARQTFQWSHVWATLTVPEAILKVFFTKARCTHTHTPSPDRFLPKHAAHTYTHTYTYTYTHSHTHTHTHTHTH